jgi:hypothetical protein
MRIVNRQYRDNLQLTRYPFQGTEPLITTSGAQVPDQLFLDLAIMVTEETVAVALTQIVVASATAIASFSDNNGTVVAIANLSTVDGQGQVVLMKGSLQVGYALVSLNAVTIVNGWPAGTYTLDAPILSHLLVISDPAWLAGYLLPDGTVLTGDVYLVADHGLWLNHTSTGFQFNVTGDPYTVRTAAAVLTALNGVAPDSNGNVTLFNLGAAGSLTGPFRLQITPEKNDLRIALIGGDT